jgi:hypothetical protein
MSELQKQMSDHDVNKLLVKILHDDNLSSSKKSDNLMRLCVDILNNAKNEDGLILLTENQRKLIVCLMKYGITINEVSEQQNDLIVKATGFIL